MSYLNLVKGDPTSATPAYIGGDLSGNARGYKALDIQSYRNGVINVASANYSVSVGLSCYSKGTYSAGLGYRGYAVANGSIAIGGGGGGTITSGDYSIAIGASAQTDANGDYAAAIGYDAHVAAASALALGRGARANKAGTTNIRGPIIVAKDALETDEFLSFGGVEVVILSEEVNLKTTQTKTIALPAQTKFWWDECGVICTAVNSLVTQPTVSFGITGDNDKQVTAAITTALTAAGKREVETPLVPEDGETTLVAEITGAADATSMSGRFYWKGIFVEDE